jgi:hypothetical protein
MCVYIMLNVDVLNEFTHIFAVSTQKNTKLTMNKSLVQHIHSVSGVWLGWVATWVNKDCPILITQPITMNGNRKSNGIKQGFSITFHDL